MLSRKTLIISISVVMIANFLGSCNSDTDMKGIEMEGKWIIHNTIRNKQPSKTANGGYFVFQGDTLLKTNIPLDPQNPSVSEKSFRFEKKGDVLSLIDLQPKLKFKLKSNQKDSLSLSCKIQYSPLTFYLVRDTI